MQYNTLKAEMEPTSYNASTSICSTDIKVLLLHPAISH